MRIRALALLVLPIVLALPLVKGAHAAKDGAPSERLAVLEFTGGGLMPDVLASLSDEARAGALDAVKQKGMLVMTRESMSAIVADMGACTAEGACEVETARNIGATFVVTGDLAKVGPNLSLSLKLFDVKSGALLATDSIEAKNVSMLKGVIRTRTQELLDVALARGGSGGASDAPPPQAALTGPSSARLAKPVVVKYGPDFPRGEITFLKSDGKESSQASDVPMAALKTYALGVARRHFEDASFTPPPAVKGAKKGAKNAEPVREIVIQSVSVVVNQGPSYQVRVVVDRVQDGKRLGQATGQGFAMPDRTTERTRAAFVPGIFGAVASQKASQANASKDAATVEIAVVQALDSACLQLAAYWAGEQMVEDMQKKR
jgi:TolB-like protein